MKDGYSTYRRVKVDTADQGKLILICYDVAIKSCKISLEKFGSASAIEERTKLLFKAQDAIAELMGALNMDVGEIAKNLYRIYEYLMHRLVEANIKSDQSCVEDVLKHLESLREAWVIAIDNIKKESLDGTEPVLQQNFALTV
jgi:flagellar protein FliS